MNAPTATPRTESQQLASVLREETSVLGDVITLMIDSRSETEFGPEAFIKALETIRGVQIQLEGEIEKLQGANGGAT